MKLKLAIIAGAAIVEMVSCTKLETKLQSSFLYTPGGGKKKITALLNGTYNDLNGLLNGQIRYSHSKRIPLTSAWYLHGVETGMITACGACYMRYMDRRPWSVPICIQRIR